MKTWVRRSLNAGALAAGALLAAGVAGSPASADVVTAGNSGVLNGNQVLLPVQVPVNICGIAVAVAGDAAAGCHGGAAARVSPEWKYGHEKPGGYGKDRKGGKAGHKDEGYRLEALPDLESNRSNKPNQPGVDLVSHGNAGILNGNQVYVPVQVPINLCGIAVAVLGDAQASCHGGAAAS